MGTDAVWFLVLWMASLFRAMQPREPGYCPRCKAETPHVVLD